MIGGVGQQSGQPRAAKSGGGAGLGSPATASLPASNIRGTLPPPNQPVIIAGGGSSSVAPQTYITASGVRGTLPPPPPPAQAVPQSVEVGSPSTRYGTRKDPVPGMGAPDSPIKPGNNDCVLAKQLQLEAEKETDPELKERLIKESQRMCSN